MIEKLRRAAVAAQKERIESKLDIRLTVERHGIGIRGKRADGNATVHLVSWAEIELTHDDHLAWCVTRMAQTLEGAQ
jgi:hypothetical protein